MTMVMVATWQEVLVEAKRATRCARRPIWERGSFSDSEYERNRQERLDALDYVQATGRVHLGLARRHNPAAVSGQ